MTETKKFGNLSGNRIKITTCGINAVSGNIAHTNLPNILNKNKINAVIVEKKQPNKNSMTFKTLGDMYGNSGNSKKVEINSSFSHLKVKKDNQLG